LEDGGVVKEDAMRRVSIPEADAIIGKHFPVLGKGFVALVDYMGNDAAIVQAARVSYGMGTKSVNDDAGLINYLMRHRHTSPFEMVEIKFLASMPIYVAREWVRHRTASINEYSARYSVLPGKFDIPELERIGAQSTKNRQGREGSVAEDVAASFKRDVEEISGSAYERYQRALEGKVAREQARILLPVNTYTEWYWKIDLHNLFHFLSLRLSSHAQEEIREYAKAIAEITKRIVPVAYAAFENHSLNNVTFSAKEMRALKRLFAGATIEDACAAAGLKLFRDDGKRMSSGEGIEFVEKVQDFLHE
jgi:thymidylate synthase (FAD)